MNREREIAKHANSLGIGELWKTAVDSFTGLGNFNRLPVTNGFSFFLPALKLPGQATNYHGSHSLRLDPSGKLRIIFFPAAVDLCSEKFEQQQHIPFKYEKPPNAPPTKKIADQWYCLLNSDEWNKHKPALTGLASDVYEAWEEARLNANSG